MFTPIPREMVQFDEHMFQMDWFNMVQPPTRSVFTLFWSLQRKPAPFARCEKNLSAYQCWATCIRCSTCIVVCETSFSQKTTDSLFISIKTQERRTRMWVVRMALILFGHCRDEGHGNGNFYDFDTPHTMRHQLRRNYPEKGDASVMAQLGCSIGVWLLVGDPPRLRLVSCRVGSYRNLGRQKGCMQPFCSKNNTKIILSTVMQRSLPQ